VEPLSQAVYVSPKRRPSQDALRASRTGAGLVDILQAYREVMEGLRLPTPDYLEQALERTRKDAAEILEAGADEWDVFNSHVDEALGFDQGMLDVTLAKSEEDRAQRLATVYFLNPWMAVADPKARLAPVPEDAAREAVSFAMAAFLSWRRRLESLSISEGGISEAAIKLAWMDASVAMETNLARSPIFSGRKPRGPLQLSLLRVGSLYDRPFNVFEPKGPLTVQDAQLLAHLIKRYAEDDFPSDRRVRMSLSEAARASGYSGAGGKQRELVRAAFRRMTSTTYHHAGRWPDGTEWSLSWHLLDWTYTVRRSENTGLALATLSEPLVTLIRAGSLVYLQKDLFAELVRRDEYGARLWVFLESESYPAPRAYPYLLFSAPEGEPECERHTPAIADLLRIDWASRKKIAARMRKAAQVVEETDPRYSLSVETAKGRGMWKLEVRKGRGSTKGLDPESTPRDLTGYPQGPYRVPPGTLPGTLRDRATLLPPAKPEVSEHLPSVLPSGIPSEKRFDFLEKQLGEPFGVSVEELRSPDSDWYKTLSRASSRFREMLPTYFPGADPEEEEELLKRLLRSMVASLREKSPKDPLRYLSTSVKKACTPEGLLIEAYALESIRAWYGANSKARAEAFGESYKAWNREHSEGGNT